ncbi:unnamed protein product, partial [Didymodactylos carnosus]
LCRDEITSPFKNVIESIYGSAFSCGSLGGMLLCGRTGFSAAHSHVPIDDACLIYYCFTHIAINENGQIGSVLRNKTGMKQESSACGALVAFTRELKSGIRQPIHIDENDVEMTFLKKQLLNTLPTLAKQQTTLLEVTHTAYLTITSDLENHVIDDSKNHEKRQYALFTGVQIHGPNGHDYVWLGKSSFVKHGKLENFPFDNVNHK